MPQVRMASRMRNVPTASTSAVYSLRSKEANCHAYYKKFDAGCQQYKEAAEPLQGEIGVVREMLQLLPLKINTVKARLG